jgi:hypothetical protein
VAVNTMLNGLMNGNPAIGGVLDFEGNEFERLINAKKINLDI